MAHVVACMVGNNMTNDQKSALFRKYHAVYMYIDTKKRPYCMFPIAPVNALALRIKSLR